MSKIMNKIHKVLLDSEQGISAEEIFTTTIELFPRAKFLDLGNFTSEHCGLGEISFNEGLLSDVRNWWSVYYQPRGCGFHVMSPSSFFPDDGSSDRILVAGINMYLVGNESERLLENGYYMDYRCLRYQFVDSVDIAVWTEDIQELKLEITLKRVSHSVSRPDIKIHKKLGIFLLNPPEAEFHPHIEKEYNSTEVSEAPASEPGSINVEKYFLSTRFSDISVKCEGILFPLHRMVIEEKCPTFAELFKPAEDEECGSGDFGGGPSWVVDLHGVEEIVFTEFLRFMYTGIVENMSAIGISLYEFAHNYQYEQLKDYCEFSLLDHIDSENMLNMYVFAKKYDLAKLISRANDVFVETASFFQPMDDYSTSSQSHCELVLESAGAVEDAEEDFEYENEIINNTGSDFEDRGIDTDSGSLAVLTRSSTPNWSSEEED